MPTLEIEKGDNLQIQLNENQKQCYIGRENCEITIPSDSLSRKHAQITLTQDGNYCLCDLGSTNGSFINGSPLKPKTHYKLQEGDELIFGNVKAIFTDKDELVNTDLNTNQSTVPAIDYSFKQKSTNNQINLNSNYSNYRNEVKAQIASELKYAGFWIRFLASFIDGLVLGLPSFLVTLVIGLTKNSTLIIISQLLLNIVIPWLYFAILESSIYQGTVGKKLLGIKVVDLQGNKISFLKATGRYWGKILSSIILLIGYIMAAFTEKKQALHDMIAGCLVVKK